MKLESFDRFSSSPQISNLI